MHPSRNPWGISSGARYTTESGEISLVGISNGPRGCNPRGLSLTGVIESASGAITIHDQTVSTNHGNSGPFINGPRIGAGDLSGSTSDIVLIGDRFFFNGGTVETSGTFAIRPNGPSFLDAQSYPVNLTSTDIGALTLGKAGNTSNITIASAVPTIPGDVMLHGNTLAVNGTLATGATLMLDAAVAATQTAAITAADLRLTGAGTFTLTSDANQIGTVAGGTVATPLGSASVVDASGGLAIGTTSGDGIVAVGTIDIATVEGDITLRADLSTDDGSSDAIVINAGRSRLPGDADGGDISVSGTPVLTTGTGGVVRLFSGGQARSTGLTALVGGAGNVRFGVDETSTISPVLLAGARYALYRETTPSGGVTAGSSEAGGGGGAGGPSLACTPDPVVAGGTVTCRVTDGPPNADILWRAGLDADGAEPFAGGPVRTDGSGAGTFVFRAPRDASGARVDIELVAWSVDTAVLIVGGPVPASVPSGEGPVPTPGWLFSLALLAAAGAVVAVRRQVVTG